MTEFESFLAGLSFRSIQPQRDLPRRVVYSLAARAGWLWAWIERWNTRLPIGSQEIRQRLAPIAAMPRMSNFAVGAIINRGVSLMKDGYEFVNFEVSQSPRAAVLMIGGSTSNHLGIKAHSK